MLAPAVTGAPSSPVYRVTNDPGGPVLDRMALVEKLRASRTRVEITGGCWSSCTLFLGLADACVSRRARLGFHGPSSPIHGVALAPDQFERYSRLMASYYPEPLRSWFLREGRNVTVGFTKFRGIDLIRLGIPEC